MSEPYTESAVHEVLRVPDEGAYFMFQNKPKIFVSQELIESIPAGALQEFLPEMRAVARQKYASKRFEDDGSIHINKADLPEFAFI